jgi:4-amino-4-deoxy-L-arabinose transferase-like glycosyltransferase
MTEIEWGLGLEDALERRGEWWRNGTAIVAGIAVGTVVMHLVTGGRYGFDRDELMALEDARHLAWGYVTYPPMTAFFGRAALMMFGTSLTGFRFFAGVAQAVALVLTGLMAKELGGGRWAQVVAAMAGVPFCLGGGALMSYISFDYVCWVVVAYCMVHMLGGRREKQEEGVEEWKSERVKEWRSSVRARWWLGVGAGIGLGMMAKYTMGFLAVGVAAGVLLTSARKYLRSGWLWAAAMVAVGIFLPHVLWEWRRDFVSLEFLRFIHERDVRTGATDWFLLGQLKLMLLAFPLAMAGIYFYFFAEEGRRYRALGWMYAVPLAMLLVLRGRDYYLAPGYPMLYAAGAVWVERKWRVASGEWREKKEKDSAETQRTRRFAEKRGDLGQAGVSQPGESGGVEWADRLRRRSLRNEKLARLVRGLVWVALVVDVVVAGAVALPIAPVDSGWWRLAARVDTAFPEEIGWPEFVETVGQVRDRLPAEERVHAGILAGNYGEVGALNLYGEKYGLPRAISGVNSSWERGYGERGPETVIVTGYSREFLERHFASCKVGGRVWNRFGVKNEETREDEEVFVCKGLRGSWEVFWRGIRGFA